MRRACLTILSLVLASGAAIDGATQGAPRFTLAEEVVIARNDALSELHKIDPWSVRRIIDAMAAAKLQPPRERQRDMTERRDGAVEIDPGRNPDLDIFQRASPEAAYDLFQLLKRVRGQSGAKQP
jgi:hypothetical protein